MQQKPSMDDGPPTVEHLCREDTFIDGGLRDTRADEATFKPKLVAAILLAQNPNMKLAEACRRAGCTAKMNNVSKTIRKHLQKVKMRHRYMDIDLSGHANLEGMPVQAIAHTSETSKEPQAHRPVLVQPVAQRTYEQACCHTNVVPSVDPNDPLIRLNVAARDLLNANRIDELSAFASYWVVELAEPLD